MSGTAAQSEEGRVDVSFVVPVFDETATLPALFAALDDVMARLEDRYVCEVVLIDDGSRDGSWSVIAEQCARDPRYAGVRLSRNFGHQVAITSGYRFARGRAVISLDCDLQDPPEVSLRLIEKWEEGADIVYAVRTERAGETWFKRTSATLFYRLQRALTDSAAPADAGDFRLLSRRAVDALNRLPERHRYVRGLVGWVGFHTATVEYARAARLAGTTKYPLWKMTRLATDAIVSMSVTPLRLAYLMALLISLPFLGYLLFNLAAWLLYDVEMERGWPSLILAITVFGSAILLFLGVMGEYLGRIYEESKRRPLFLVAERTPRDTEDDPH